MDFVVPVQLQALTDALSEHIQGRVGLDDLGHRLLHQGLAAWFEGKTSHKRDICTAGGATGDTCERPLQGKKKKKNSKKPSEERTDQMKRKGAGWQQEPSTVPSKLLGMNVNAVQNKWGDTVWK